MAKFLLIRFSSIGDIVLTSPVIRCLKTQVKDAEIHYLTKKQFKPVLANNPYIDRLWLLEKDLDSLLNEIKALSIDYVIDLHHNLRSSIVRRKLGLPSYSFPKLNLEKWILVNLKINRLPDLHIVDRYMETVKFTGIHNDGLGLDYFLSEEDENLPGEVKVSIPDQYIALVIGAQHDTKKMPAPMLGELCSGIELPVLILGGPSDREAAEEIKKNCGKVLIDTTGKLSLNQSAFLVRNALAVVSHDTGLMHIAAAFGKPVFSIWGNTVPEFGMYPYKTDPRSKIYEVSGLSCRPCSKIGYDRCPKSHFRCMKNQDIPGLQSELNHLIRDFREKVTGQ